MTASADLLVRGWCDPAFQRVHDTFATGLLATELGAGVAVFVDGAPVAELWGGWRDEGRAHPWERDTLVNTFSTTKGLAATCALRLVERGQLALDEPVLSYWPEFGQAGKGDVTVRQVLTHEAGLPVMGEVLPWEHRYDWDAATRVLAGQPLAWEAGSRSEYHAMTFGYLVGELVRRVDGRTLGRFFDDEVAGPLGADVSIGLRAPDAHRCADVSLLAADGAPEDVELAHWAAEANTPEWRAAEIPAANAHATAMGVARFYASLARGGLLDGVEVLHPETIEQAVRPPSVQGDLPFGLGFMLVGRLLTAALGDAFPGGAVFGHPGVGGCLGVADPVSRVGFGFVRNRLRPGVEGSLAAIALLDAVYRDLGAAR